MFGLSKYGLETLGLRAKFSVEFRVWLSDFRWFVVLMFGGA